jgi:hypothetical protein
MEEEKIMQIKHFSFIVIAALVFSVGISDSATAAKKITKSIEYKSNQKDKKTNHFKTKIKLSHKTYHICNIQYNVISQKPVMRKKELTLKTVSKAIKPGTKHTVKEKIKRNGLIYTIVKVNKKSTIVKKGWIQKASAWKDYSSYKEAKAAARNKMIKTNKTLDGKTIRVNGKKTSIKKTTGHWKNSHINIHFISYGASSFRFGNIWIPKNTKHPMKGYEKELLKSATGNGTKWQLKKII